jgi:hypothetical protein
MCFPEALIWRSRITRFHHFKLGDQPMVRGMIRKLALSMLQHNGYSPYMASVLFYGFITDLSKTKISLKKKLWSYRRGFMSKRIFEWGLTETNYLDYETDFRYYKTHPVNGRYNKWIDDKITTRYLLHPFAEYMPKYYFQVEKGKVTKLMDCPAKYNADMDSVVDLLKCERHLAIKLVSGSYGSGFYKLSYDGNDYFANDKKMNEQECRRFLESLDDHFASEYLISHELIRKIYSIAPNTLRIVVVRNNNHTNVIGAFYKFGTSLTGTIDNIHAGGISCGVNIQNGVLYGPKWQKGDRLIDMPIHMDTKVRIEGTVPYWDLIVAKLVEIGDYIPQVKYIGYDIIVTDNGFKIIELNSHPDLDAIQVYYPMMKDSRFTSMLYNNLEAS